jgi:hypothetical protein
VVTDVSLVSASASYMHTGIVAVSDLRSCGPIWEVKVGGKECSSVAYVLGKGQKTCREGIEIEQKRCGRAGGLMLSGLG